MYWPGSTAVWILRPRNWEFNPRQLPCFGRKQLNQHVSHRDSPLPFHQLPYANAVWKGERREEMRPWASKSLTPSAALLCTARPNRAQNLIQHTNILWSLWKTTDNKHVLLIWVHSGILDLSDSFARVKNKDFRISCCMIPASSKRISDEWCKWWTIHQNLHQEASVTFTWHSWKHSVFCHQYLC